MIIKKIYNNNVILSRKKNVEVVLMGKGLGFQKKEGDIVNEQQVEKWFVLNKLDEEYWNHLSREVPEDYYLMISEIIEMIKDDLSPDIPESLYITLLDHLAFAIERLREGKSIKNPLFFDMKRLYPREITLALKILDYIFLQTGQKLTQDEAGFIALHILNATGSSQTSEYIKKQVIILQDVLDIIETFFKIQLDENSLNYARFVTHVQFFVQRTFMEKEMLQEEEQFLIFKALKQQFPKIYQGVLQIVQYFFEKYQIEVTVNEQTYLMLHLQRIIKKERD